MSFKSRVLLGHIAPFLVRVYAWGAIGLGPVVRILPAISRSALKHVSCLDTLVGESGGRVLVELTVNCEYLIRGPTLDFPTPNSPRSGGRVLLMEPAVNTVSI